MDVWEHEGRTYEVVMASDITRDGMGLELTDLGAPESGPALEAFWHDDGSGFDFTAHHAATLPFAVVERVRGFREKRPSALRQRLTAVEGPRTRRHDRDTGAG